MGKKSKTREKKLQRYLNVTALEKTDVNEDETVKIFKGLGVHPEIGEILSEKSIRRPTKLQSVALPLMLKTCKHAVIRAESGSGKTLSLLITLAGILRLAFDDSEFKSSDPVTLAIVVVPSFELCKPICDELEDFFETYLVTPIVVALKSTMRSSKLDALFRKTPDVIISTPDCVERCFKSGLIKTRGVRRGMAFLVFDEIDQLPWNEYEHTIKSIIAQVPEYCTCYFSCSDPSADVDRLRSLVNKNPHIITLPKLGDVKVEIFPYNVEQSYIRCNSRDKILHCLALLVGENKLRGKTLIFTNSVSELERLRFIFQELKFKSADIVPGMLADRFIFILEEFNAGKYDRLIIGSHYKENKQQCDWELGIMTGINLDSVDTVINFDMPPTIDGYANRVNRVGRTRKLGGSISLVSPEEESILAEIKSSLRDEDSKIIAPCKLITECMLERSRYILKMYGMQHPGQW